MLFHHYKHTKNIFPWLKKFHPFCRAAFIHFIVVDFRAFKGIFNGISIIFNKRKKLISFIKLSFWKDGSKFPKTFSSILKFLFTDVCWWLLLLYLKGYNEFMHWGQPLNDSTFFSHLSFFFLRFSRICRWGVVSPDESLNASGFVRFHFSFCCLFALVSQKRNHQSCCCCINVSRNHSFV